MSNGTCDVWPNITGSVTNVSETFDLEGKVEGAFSKEKGHEANATPDRTDYSDTGKMFFKASDSNVLYGKSQTVQPSSLRLLPCIKV